MSGRRLVFPPGPRSKIPGRLELQFLRNAPHFMRELSTHGDVAYFRFLSTHVYLVNEPELIKRTLAADHRSFVKGRSMNDSKRMLGEGLLTSEGEFHHSQRRLLQPALHRARVQELAPRIVDVTDRALSRWSDGETVDMHVEMSRLTLEVLGQALLSTDLENDSSEIVAALSHAVLWTGRLSLPFARLWERSPLASARVFRTSLDRLDRATEEILARRRARTDDPDDAMSLLLAAQADDEHRLTDRQVRDETITLLLAGHETTANALTWTLYLLSAHPEVEQRAVDELDRVLGRRLPTAADAEELEYLERVLNEALRLYPPVWAWGRRATEDYQLDGYVVPKGAVVTVNTWVTQHDPRFYPDPFRFDPERWTPEARSARPRSTFFPFGGGPRICLGAAFAMLEAKLVLAMVLQRWRFSVAPGHPVEMRPGMTLRPRRGIRMVLEPRNGTRARPVPPDDAHHDKKSDFWDAAVELWELRGQQLWRQHSDKVNSRLVGRWLPAGLRRVLKTDLWDEAVGHGIFDALAERAEEVVGVDVSHGVVRAAKERHARLVAAQADVRRLPFDDEFFDAAVSNSTLDHFDSTADISAALRELHRVILPGGALLLTLDNPSNPFVALTRLLPRERLNRIWLDHARGAARVGMLPYYVGVTVDAKRLRQLLAGAGFDVRTMSAAVHAPRALAALVGAVLERRGSLGAQARFANLLERCERLESSFARLRTGHFTAVLATRK